MRISIRYFRPNATGNFTTINLEDIVLEETSVLQLKRKIFIKLKLEAQNQKLSIRSDSGVLIVLDDLNVLKLYKLTEKIPIYLENTLLGLRMDLALDSFNNEKDATEVSV